MVLQRLREHDERKPSRLEHLSFRNLVIHSLERRQHAHHDEEAVHLAEDILRRRVLEHDLVHLG